MPNPLNRAKWDSRAVFRSGIGPGRPPASGAGAAAAAAPEAAAPPVPARLVAELRRAGQRPPVPQRRRARRAPRFARAGFCWCCSPLGVLFAFWGRGKKGCLELKQEGAQ